MIEALKKQIDQENERMTKHPFTHELTFVYPGKAEYTAKIVRYREYSHLCGYIKRDFEMTDKIYDALNDNSRGGITYYTDNWIGFDCNHAWDFNLDRYLEFDRYGFAPELKGSMVDEVYRDLDYVIETLKEMIKAVIETEDE